MAGGLCENKSCSFSIIIPVYCEADRINSQIEHILTTQNGEDFEIIVADGEESNSTINVIDNEDVIKLTSGKGRGKQMNAAARAANGDVLLFLHADTKLPEGALAKIGETLCRTNYVGGAFDLGIASKKFLIKLIAARARIRSRMSRVPYGDQAIFIRREYFEKIGGYREIVLMEDVDLMRRIKKLGDKIIIIRQRVMTSSRRWEKEGAIYTTLRNMLLVNLFRLGVDPQRLAKYYRCHTSRQV